MSTFDLLEGRHHVRKYSDKIPPKEQIESALWKAWKTTPTKNNAMPYKIFVYGPDKKEEKFKAKLINKYSKRKDFTHFARCLLNVNSKGLVELRVLQEQQSHRIKSFANKSFLYFS